MICAEVTLYPLKAADGDAIITQSIDALKGEGVSYEVGSISTHLHGDVSSVWSGLRTLFDEAQSRGGEVSMVVTLTNSAH